MVRMIFGLFFVLGLVVGTIGYSFYQARGWGGVGMWVVIAVVIFASVVALLRSAPSRNVWEIFTRDPYPWDN